MNKEIPTLREYLYIDDIEINSILAQINQGLNQKTTRAAKHNELNSISHNQSGTVRGEAKANVPLIASGTASASGSAGRESHNTVSDEDSNMVESVYNDFGVEILEAQLNEDGILQYGTNNLHYGDFVKITEPFDIVDFAVIEAVTEPGLLKEVMSQGVSHDDISRVTKELDKLNKKSHQHLSSDEITEIEQKTAQLTEMKANLKQAQEISDNSKSVYEFGKLGNALFRNSVLIHGDSFNSYGERNHFRFDSVQLSMLQNNPRKGTILGIVENSVNLDKDPYADMNAISGTQLSRIDSYFINNIFKNFNLVKNGTLMIKPVAIYFD